MACACRLWQVAMHIRLKLRRKCSFRPHPFTVGQHRAVRCAEEEDVVRSIGLRDRWKDLRNDG